MTDSNEALAALTAGIVSAYVGKNRVPASELAALIASTHTALIQLGAPPPVEAQPAQVPAVSIKKSITPDALICLEDGKPFKTLKRHLMTTYDLTPDQYRAKWGLPADYPMVAPAYAERRSELARSMGLGRKTGARVEKAERTAKAKT